MSENYLATPEFTEPLYRFTKYFIIISKINKKDCLKLDSPFIIID
ncbi:hypothetical protein QF024_000615 [Chryseobacterium nepalense]|nr:hypothetical protein [Chryseobacterium nepalense]